MSELFLVAHKVRGKATFDVAVQMSCPECNGTGWASLDIGCMECEGGGYWWIIPTSGHRAYPYFDVQLQDQWMAILSEMPEDLQDHYKCGPAPKFNIRSLFKATQKPTIQRRF